MQFARFVACSVVLTSTFAGLAQGASIIPQSTPQEIDAAEYVCPVKFKSIETRLRGDRVESLAQVNLLEPCLKGDLPKTFYVLYPGGTYSLATPRGEQRLTTRIPGLASFSEGAFYLLYLSKTDERHVMAMSSW